MIASASVRYRLYSAWGLSALEITKVVAFCSLTLWFGFFPLVWPWFFSAPMSFWKRKKVFSVSPESLANGSQVWCHML